MFFLLLGAGLLGIMEMCTALKREAHFVGSVDISVCFFPITFYGRGPEGCPVVYFLGCHFRAIFCAIFFIVQIQAEKKWRGKWPKNGMENSAEMARRTARVMGTQVLSKKGHKMARFSKK